MAVATGSLTFGLNSTYQDSDPHAKQLETGAEGKVPEVVEVQLFQGIVQREREVPYTKKSAGFDYPSTGTAEVAARAGAGRRELPGIEGSDRPVAAAYGMRERAVPERGRVLEPAHRDVHDPGERLHTAVRVLRGRERAAAAH